MPQSPAAAKRQIQKATADLKREQRKFENSLRKLKRLK